MSVSPEDMNLHYLNFIAASALGKKKNREKKGFSLTLFSTQSHGLKKIRFPNSWSDNITQMIS